MTAQPVGKVDYFYQAGLEIVPISGHKSYCYIGSSSWYAFDMKKYRWPYTSDCLIGVLGGLSGNRLLLF